MVGLVSAYGQLYNQLRDYAMDRAACLRNTASILGPRRTQIAMYACLAGAATCLAVTVLMGMWPLWLALVAVIMVPFALLSHSDKDMRGTAAVDVSGQLQGRAMMGANAIMLVWLAANVIG
jgi:1,4-dihydroxy-2-naphthoate octaprenyltransferase